MRNPERIDEFCAELAQLWHKYPDFRFGQLIEDMLAMNNIYDMYYMEDDEMLDMLQCYLSE